MRGVARGVRVIMCSQPCAETAPNGKWCAEGGRDGPVPLPCKDILCALSFACASTMWLRPPPCPLPPAPAPCPVRTAKSSVAVALSNFSLAVPNAVWSMKRGE